MVATARPKRWIMTFGVAAFVMACFGEYVSAREKCPECWADISVKRIEFGVGGTRWFDIALREESQPSAALARFVAADHRHPDRRFTFVSRSRSLLFSIGRLMCGHPTMHGLANLIMQDPSLADEFVRRIDAGDFTMPEMRAVLAMSGKSFARMKRDPSADEVALLRRTAAIVAEHKQTAPEHVDFIEEFDLWRGAEVVVPAPRVSPSSPR